MIMKVLFIYRAPEFSPNNVQHDAAILDAVADGLSPRCSLCEKCSEEALPADLELFDLIFHMARRPATLALLRQLSRARVVNAPDAVSLVSSSRGRTLELLHAAGILVPQWMSLNQVNLPSELWQEQLLPLLPGWIKCIRHTGSYPGDVTFVDHLTQVTEVVQRLVSRPLADLILTRHLPGDLVKCYYVDAPIPFLRWFYPQDKGYSKFGEAEMHNSDLSRIPFQTAQLEAVAQGISKALGLQVFGFDVIVSPKAADAASPCISVIDVNDWPTFGICRSEAAEAIIRIFNTD